jgi:DNA replication protein DnaC
LAEQLRTLRAAGSYTGWLAQLAKTEVLLLDDWGLLGLDALRREALMEIIDDRSAARATIITSQLPVEHWHTWGSTSRPWPTPCLTACCPRRIASS